MKEFTFARTIPINAPASQVWQSLIDPAIVVKYHLAPLRDIELREGGAIVYGTENAEMIRGRITRLKPCAFLEHTFRFSPGYGGTNNEPETLVSYTLSDTKSGSTLTLTHSGFPEENQMYANISGGWPYILDRFKALLESESGQE
jgi:uncharacterized protein YndB with AHSA1/START domain